MVVKLVIYFYFIFVFNVYIICVNIKCMFIFYLIKEKKILFVRIFSDKMIDIEWWVELEIFLLYCLFFCDKFGLIKNCLICRVCLYVLCREYI